jgi:2-dehydropantoate 2-reductase
MRISMIGAGGVGGYFGARLAESGNTVDFFVRGDHKAAIDQKGLFIKSIKGDIHLKKVNTYDRIVDLPPAELVVIAVKSWQIRQIAEELKTVLSDNTIVLPLQNGVLAVEELKDILPQNQVLGGLCRIFSMIESPGVINHPGVEPTIIFGEMDNVKSARVLKLIEIFADAKIASVVPADIQVERWKKFITICLSGLMAVSRTTYGEMISIPEIRSLMYELMEEVRQVGIAKGVHVEADHIEKAAGVFKLFRHEATASLTRDIWAGRPSEIEYQNGTVVRFGQDLGVDVPVNRFVYYSLLPSELKAREKIK